MWTPPQAKRARTTSDEIIELHDPNADGSQEPIRGTQSILDTSLEPPPAATASKWATDLVDIRDTAETVQEGTMLDLRVPGSPPPLGMVISDNMSTLVESMADSAETPCTASIEKAASTREKGQRKRMWGKQAAIPKKEVNHPGVDADDPVAPTMGKAKSKAKGKRSNKNKRQR